MTLLQDQRTMHGAAPHETVESVKAFWELFAERQREAGRPFELHRSRKKLVAYVSDGRWVADCPECAGGIALWAENPEACCLDCGSIFSNVGWPEASEMQEAERVLAARPVGAWHWLPASESVTDLKVENLTRGYGLSAEAAAELTIPPDVESDEVDRLWRELVDPGRS